jgi:hypothetical protein
MRNAVTLRKSRLLRLIATTVSMAIVATPALAGIRIAVTNGEASAPAAGATLAFEVETVGAGGYQLGDRRPRVWLVSNPAKECAMPTSLSKRSEIGGRMFYILHADNSISAVNPAYDLASSNIQWLTPLPAKPESWWVDAPNGALVVRFTQGETRLGLNDGKPTQKVVAKPAAYAAARSPWYDLRSTKLSATAERTLVSDWSAVRFTLGDSGMAIAAAALDDLATGPEIIPLKAPASGLLLSPDQRWLFAIDGKTGLVQVVQVASKRLNRLLQMKNPIAVAAFSDDYLYLREAGTNDVRQFRLSSLDERQEHANSLRIGNVPSADAMVPLGSDGMAFLSSAERLIYLYMESGMSDRHGTMRSPSENFGAYASIRLRGSQPIDLRAHDAGLVQLGTGKYSGLFSVPGGGRWRLIARDAVDGAVACHDFDVAGAGPGMKARAPTLALIPGRNDAVGLMRDGEGLVADSPAELELLAIEPGSNWQMAIKVLRQKDGSYRLPPSIQRGGPLMLIPTRQENVTGSVTIGGETP